MVDTTRARNMARLTQLLLGMERDLGIDDLSTVQKKIFYAATLLSEKSRHFETDEMRRHELLDGVSRSAFFRALKEVVGKGMLSHFGDSKRSCYTLEASNSSCSIHINNRPTPRSLS